MIIIDMNLYMYKYNFFLFAEAPKLIFILEI